MRPHDEELELPKPLRKGQTFSFKIKYYYNINDRLKIGGRSGYEYFEEDDNSIYTIARINFPTNGSLTMK